ncbi:MAG TPA: hypothetical protein VF077_12435 [Nitrospiraceae bacterium]
MTRDERAAQHVAVLKRKQTAITKQLARIEAQQRLAAQKQRDRRRYAVGALAEEAGLFAWSDADLAALMQALVLLAAVSTPRAVIAGILHGMTTNGTDNHEEGKSTPHETAILSENSHGSEETARIQQKHTRQKEEKIAPLDDRED